MKQIQCPKCTQRLQVPDVKPGQMIRCPKCGQTLALSVPSAAPPVKALPSQPASQPSPAPLPPAQPIAKPPPPATPAIPTVSTPPQEEYVELEEVTDAPTPATPSAGNHVPAPAPTPTVETAVADTPAVEGLGRRVKEFSARKWWIVLILILLPTCLDFPLGGIAIFTQNKVFINVTMIPLFFLALGVLLFAVLTLLSVNRRVVIHEGGLVCHGLTKTTECLWSEISGVCLVRAGFPPSVDVSLDLANGTKLTLPSMVRGLEEVAERVMKATTPFVAATANAALDRGETVAFGPNISLNGKGLQFRPGGKKGKELKMKWKEVDSITVGRFQANPGAGGLAGGLLSSQVRISGETADPPLWILDAGVIANVAVFLEIAEKRFGVDIERP
jgi:hypothetical protein